MTKGDRDKLRAEIAGRALNGIIMGALSGSDSAKVYREVASANGMTEPELMAEAAVEFTDALLDRLGLSEEAETAAIRKMADELRSVP